MEWTVDYGDGPRPCTVPHAWRQDVDVRWEGPVVYQTKIQVDSPDTWLVFHGVSYQARVFIDDVLAIEHRGIWDGFSVPLPSSETGYVDVRVDVVKNGGASFPVKDVLSGFLPYVYHTFGGIFREVEVLDYDPFGPRRDAGAPESRITVERTKLFIDDKPWFMRGVLSWGWYPELGHPNPSPDEIRDEVRKVKALGFNLVKFCLWLPPHSYFQVLEEEDMWAWVELPLWMPSENMDLEEAFAECERIVRQYRHHDRIVCWTCGCELSTSTPHEFRKRLFEMVTDLTGCPLVKDNSGGSEMYGGDLREYGTFYDFHPYCDTQFYPVVLESLQVGPRKKMPILLGEFNDYDVYRPLGPLRGKETIESHPEFPWVIQTYESDKPYWASSDPRLNDQGVRWQHDLPAVLETGAGATNELEVRQESVWNGAWLRKYVLSNVATYDDIAGYVITGLADTPISTAGVLDRQNGDPWLFGFNPTGCNFSLVPFRKPPWVNGGNRPGWRDTVSFFNERTELQISVRSDHAFRGTLFVACTSTGGHAEAEISVEAPDYHVTVQLPFFFDGCGYHELTLSLEKADGTEYEDWFEILVASRLGAESTTGWTASFGRHDSGLYFTEAASLTPPGIPSDGRWARKDTGEALWFLREKGTLPMPFWRECVREESSVERWLNARILLFGVSTDRVIDPAWLESELPGAEWLLTRVDTRTYARHPYVARKGNTVVTTLRPWGGLGAQPYGLDNNPAGCKLLRILMKLAEG